MEERASDEEMEVVEPQKKKKNEPKLVEEEKAEGIEVAEPQKNKRNKLEKQQAVLKARSNSSKFLK
jgi:hypothetical protein